MQVSKAIRFPGGRTTDLCNTATPQLLEHGPFDRILGLRIFGSTAGRRRLVQRVSARNGSKRAKTRECPQKVGVSLDQVGKRFRGTLP